MSNRETGHEPETIIAASVKLEGDFVSQGNVLIEGVVEGSMKTTRDLRVGEKASITADVTAANATVAGEIRGNLIVTEKLDLEPSAHVYGDVRTKILTVAAGAQINGRLIMGQEAGDKSQAGKQEAEAKPARLKATEKAAVEAEDEAKERRTINAFFTR